MIHNLWWCNSVDVIKQGIWCDTWLSPWFLWVTSFTCKWSQLLVCGFLYNYKCRYTHLCEYVYLAGTGTISCMGLPYTCMQFSLLLLLVLLQHIARLHALQKLVGKSTVSLRMSIAKRFIESKRQHRCILFETRVFHPIYLKQFMTTYSTELLDFTLRVSIVVVYSGGSQQRKSNTRNNEQLMTIIGPYNSCPWLDHETCTAIHRLRRLYR